MKIRSIALAVVAAAGVVSTASAGFDGQLVSLSAGRLGVWPEPTSAVFGNYGGTSTATVGPQVEASGIGLSAGFSVNLTDSTITIAWDTGVGAISIAPPSASGAQALWIADALGTIPDITNVTLAGAPFGQLPSGITASDIAFTRDSVFLDISGSAWFVGRQSVELVVTFVPTPGSASLAGLAMLAGLRRRR